MLKIQRQGKAIVVLEAAQELPKAKVKSGTINEEQAKINQFVALWLELEAMGAFAKVKDMEEEKKGLSSLVKDGGYAPDMKVILKGTIGEVEFSPCKNSTEIVDKAGLIKKLGQDVFNELATVGLTDLKKYLSENELAQFTMSGYGSRTLKAVRGYE